LAIDETERFCEQEPIKACMDNLEMDDLEWTMAFLIFALALIALPFVVPLALAIL